MAKKIYIHQYIKGNLKKIEFLSGEYFRPIKKYTNTTEIEIETTLSLQF